MRKTFFLWFTIILFLLTLIIAFENITGSTSFLLVFYPVSQMSLFLVVLLSAILGFLICFFLMLYSYEKRLEKEREEQEETIGSAPGAVVDKKEAPKTETPPPPKEKEKPLDEFDEDDEVLG